MKKLFILFALFVNIIANAQSVYNKESVKGIMDRVNKYQQENPWQEFDDNWIRGTYYTGVMACYQATGDKKYLEQCDALGKKLNWQIPSLKPDSNLSSFSFIDFIVLACSHSC